LDKDTVRVTKEGQEVKLAPAEFALLEFLMRHPNQVFSTEGLIDRVWPTDTAVGPESVRTCVKRLRQKLGEYNNEQIVQTVHSMGYKLHVPELLH
jgi:two-component system phosphate regulon response regulator PhoB